MYADRSAFICDQQKYAGELAVKASVTQWPKHSQTRKYLCVTIEKVWRHEPADTTIIIDKEDSGSKEKDIRLSSSAYAPRVPAAPKSKRNSVWVHGKCGRVASVLQSERTKERESDGHKVYFVGNGCFDRSPPGFSRFSRVSSGFAPRLVFPTTWSSAYYRGLRDGIFGAPPRSRWFTRLS